MATYSRASDQNGTFTFGFTILLIFAVFRPLTISFHHIGSISLLDLFGMGSSYLMLISLFFYLRGQPFNAMSWLLLYFVGYCLLSFAWGSNYRAVARIVLPLLPFFLVQAVIHSQRQVKVLTLWLALGFIIPIVGSALLIASGISSYEVTQSGLQRQEGLTSGVHTAAHTMLIFSYVYALLKVQAKNQSRIWRWLLFILLLLSIYCIWKTYTRTVWLGGMLFWLIFLWARSKRWFWSLLMVGFIGALIYSTQLQDLFWQKNAAGQKVHEVDTASSGRISLWTHNFTVYRELSLPLKLLGVGIGNEMKVVDEVDMFTASSHNDYLTVLMTAGLIGLLLILGIYGGLLTVVLRSQVQRQLKFLFLGLIISVMLMNMVSNSYLTRFPIAQYFWLLMGLFYVIKDYPLIDDI